MTFSEFKLWYAKSLTENSFAQADDNKKIEDTTTPAGEEIQLIFCNPSQFTKRVTDTSEALAVDRTSPDTGTALTDVTIRIAQARTAATRTIPILAKILELFFEKSNDDIFQKGRIGLYNTDNPELNVVPTANAGYKFIGFGELPNQDTPGITIYDIIIQFVGDHTQLGTS